MKNQPVNEAEKDVFESSVNQTHTAPRGISAAEEKVPACSVMPVRKLVECRSGIRLNREESEGREYIL